MLAQALAFLRGPAPITDRAGLLDFIESRAAFLVQKSIMDYSRARSGPFFTSLLKEEPFRQAVAWSRWTLYPVGLAMVGEMVDALVRDGGAEPAGSARGVAGLAAAAMDVHAADQELGPEAWAAARVELVDTLERISGRPAKPVMDIPLAYWERVFANMPIHENRREGDSEVVRNHLRSNLCAMSAELEKRTTPERLAALVCTPAPAVG
ncbi:hypothetical protein [Xanthobacter pseudotagetidis]|uniref:hypothetical protein n=1 Tax=Xanthobacter pseudotagetidis TaxID=3119911 RepID=UPI00372818DF